MDYKIFHKFDVFYKIKILHFTRIYLTFNILLTINTKYHLIDTIIDFEPIPKGLWARWNSRIRKKYCSPFEFFARSLLSSMGNRATGRPDMSSRHHARQSIRVIYCISDSSNTHPFFLSLLSLLRYSKRNAKDIILLLRPCLGARKPENLYSRVKLIFPDKLSISML